MKGKQPKRQWLLSLLLPYCVWLVWQQLALRPNTFAIIALAILVPAICHRLASSWRAGAIAGLIAAPVALVAFVYVGCLRNAEAMAWLGVGAVFVLVLTAPIWIGGSILLSMPKRNKDAHTASHVTLANSRPSKPPLAGNKL
jgi:uncharacterized membrane protein